MHEDDASKERREAVGDDGPSAMDSTADIQECETFFLERPSVARYARMMREEKMTLKKIGQLTEAAWKDIAKGLNTHLKAADDDRADIRDRRLGISMPDV